MYDAEKMKRYYIEAEDEEIDPDTYKQIIE
jgi:hypothetical protein